MPPQAAMSAGSGIPVSTAALMVLDHAPWFPTQHQMKRTCLTCKHVGRRRSLGRQHQPKLVLPAHAVGHVACMFPSASSDTAIMAWAGDWVVFGQDLLA